MKVAIYSRKSKFTGKGDSIQNQVALCRDYLDKHFSNVTVIVYEDEGFSGGNTDRPQFQRMMKDAKSKKFDIMMCYRLDRISRNVSDFSSTIEELEKYNISFISLRENFDTTTPMGRAMMYISSVFAQLERETIAERIQDNMLHLARTGRWLGGNCPTGFESQPIIYLDEVLKEKKMFQLIPIEDELKVVGLIFDKYMELKSLSKVETYLLQNDIRTKTGKDFHKHSLRHILINPVYATADGHIFNFFLENNAQIACSGEEFDGQYGIMAYNKHLVKKGQSVKRKDMSQWVIAIGKHKGIIPGRDWVTVQKILMKNRDLAPRLGSSYGAMLSGFLRCQKCSSFMKVKYGQRNKATGQLHFYYVCSLKERSRGVRCDCNNLIGRYVDELIVNEIKKDIASGLLSGIKSRKTELHHKTEQFKKTSGKIESNKKLIANLVKQLSENESSSVAKYIIAEMEKLEEENIDLLKQLEKTSPVTEDINLDLFQESVMKFYSMIDHVPTNEKRELMKFIIKEISWDGQGFDIHYNL